VRHMMTDEREFEIPYLNMIRMYVTWSIPPSCTYCSSSSVADMNCSPDATNSYKEAHRADVQSQLKTLIIVTYERRQMSERAPLGNRRLRAGTVCQCVI
jgi:hypothetical protein